MIGIHHRNFGQRVVRKVAQENKVATLARAWTTLQGSYARQSVDNNEGSYARQSVDNAAQPPSGDTSYVKSMIYDKSVSTWRYWLSD